MTKVRAKLYSVPLILNSKFSIPLTTYEFVTYYTNRHTKGRVNSGKISVTRNWMLDSRFSPFLRLGETKAHFGRVHLCKRSGYCMMGIRETILLEYQRRIVYEELAYWMVKRWIYRD